MLEGDNNTRIALVVYASERGVILHAKQDQKLRKIASFDCSSLEELERVDLADKNVTELSKSEFNSLAADIRRNMSLNDLSAEISDDQEHKIKTKQVYAVYSNDKILGFLQKIIFKSTEGELTVLARYDRNGLRHGELEHLQ